MNGNGNRSGYRPPATRPQYSGRRRKDSKRSVMIGAVAVLFALVVLFLVLVIRECGKDGDVPADVVETPVEKMATKEIDVLASDVHKGDLILVNRTYPYVFPEGGISVTPMINGREVHGKSASGNNIYSYYTQNGIDKCAKMETETLVLFQAFADGFYNATGNSDLFVLDNDGYRTKADQDKLDSSKTGFTEHHTGKVIDLYVYTGKIRGNIDDAEFAETFKWIYDNAYKYGFILRYSAEKAGVTGVNDEPYHFRYVGYEHAYYMDKNNLCLEEYLDKLKEYNAESPLEFKADDGNTYVIYYQAASSDGNTKLTVPSEYSYTVSGDNRAGFIVSAKVEK